MSTVLDNSSRPLWVWILVIVVGSLIIIGLVAWLARCVVVRRRVKSEVNFISDEPAEKKLTLRRGRIVPAGSYLSLTGSRFGVSSYVGEDLQTPSIRSRSPFEWWANLKGRSSRLSYISHISNSYPSSPRPGSFYQRTDYSNSKISLTSKDENCQASVTEVRITKPQATLLVPSFKRMSHSYEPVNFSRSFTPQTQRSLAASRNQTLSRIEEITPRQSVFSTTSIKGHTGSRSQSETVQMMEQLASERASAASFPKLLSAQPGHSRKVSGNSSYNSAQPHYDQSHTPELHQSSSPYLPSSPATPTFPTPITDSTTSYSRHSLWDTSMKQFPWLEHHQNGHESQRYGSPNDASIAQTSFTTTNHTSPPLQMQEFDPEQTGYSTYQPQTSYSPFSSRQVSAIIPTPRSTPTLPTGPLRTHSKKGNVLRKKSLERNRILSTYV